MATQQLREQMSLMLTSTCATTRERDVCTQTDRMCQYTCPRRESISLLKSKIRLSERGKILSLLMPMRPGAQRYIDCGTDTPLKCLPRIPARRISGSRDRSGTAASGSGSLQPVDNGISHFGGAGRTAGTRLLEIRCSYTVGKSRFDCSLKGGCLG